MTSPIILFEDNHIIVVQKPAGMPSQGDPTGDPSVLSWIKDYVKTTRNKPGNAFVALVHRLDRPVGGVMIFGKTTKAANRLTEQFTTKTIQKTYWAITERIPEVKQDTLQHYLKKMPGKNIMRAYYHQVPDSKVAILDYQTLGVQDGRAWLEITPKTGRQHQIRIQLSNIGCTIVGDVKYDPKTQTRFLPDQSIALFAHRLSFIHPIHKTQQTFEAYPEPAFPWDLFPRALPQTD